jgi:hypothetical protein
MSGKMARFMMLAADQDIEYPVPPPMPPTTHGFLAVRLRALVPGLAGTVQSVQMVETPAARQTLEDYYYAIRGRVDSASSPLFGGSFSRAQMYAIKLAMIHAVANGRMTIEPGDYDAIQPIISNWADCLDEIVKKVDVENPFHETILKAEDFLKRHPKTSQRDLQRYMRLRKYEMTDVIEHMKISGLIEMGLSTEIGASQIIYKGAAGVSAVPSEGAHDPTQDDSLAREIEMAENPGQDPSVKSTVSRPGK